MIVYGEVGLRKDHPVVKFLAAEGKCKSLSVYRAGFERLEQQFPYLCTPSTKANCAKRCAREASALAVAGPMPFLNLERVNIRAAGACCGSQWHQTQHLLMRAVLPSQHRLEGPLRLHEESACCSGVVPRLGQGRLSCDRGAAGTPRRSSRKCCTWGSGARQRRWTV